MLKVCVGKGMSMCMQGGELTGKRRKWASWLALAVLRGLLLVLA